MDLPVIFHCRGALDDLALLLAEYGGGVRGVVHSFTGTPEQAKKFLELGLCIGFNGIIFRRNASLPDPEEAVRFVPLDRIVLETDSPYLIPPQAVASSLKPTLPTSSPRKP
ncbi:MAG: TatD family hydrolase [Candidatus Wildermuthbacteria bacterium]|nr:TatD family hydrolase [Candidatus Wildermuthbacteria bacterium]